MPTPSKQIGWSQESNLLWEISRTLDMVYGNVGGLQGQITLTTAGSNGPATFIDNVLNIPSYTLQGLGGVPLTRKISINGDTQTLANDVAFTVVGINISVVPNYSSLPAPATVSGAFYWVENSQGAYWLPGAIGGTFYNSGLYYSNGVKWEYMETPWQAVQSEVDAGVNFTKFVTPLTFDNAAKWNTKQGNITLTTTGSSGPATFVGNVLNIPQYSGATNLAYIASPTGGQVTSSTGTPANLTLATATNAGLLSPADYTKLQTPAPTVTASQGLTKVGNDIQLGGTITTPVLIDSGDTGAEVDFQNQYGVTRFFGDGMEIDLNDGGVMVLAGGLMSMSTSSGGVSKTVELSTDYVYVNETTGGISKWIKFSPQIGVEIRTNTTNTSGFIKTDLLTTSPKTFQLPNNSGTFALLSDLGIFTTTVKGMVPPPGTTTGKVLSDSGTWIDQSTIVAGGQTGNFTWKYNTNTTASDPGNGFFRANNASAPAVTQLYIADLTSNNQIDVSNIFSNISGKWSIYIQQRNDATKWVQYNTTTAYTDNGTWWTVPVTYVQQGPGGSIASSTDCLFTFVNENAPVIATLQTAYNNGGVSPEIITDATRGAFGVKRGSVADTDNVYEAINGAGAVTWAVTGAGVATGTQFKKQGGLATDILMADGSTTSNVPQITITTSVGITNTTTDVNGVVQTGRNVILDIGTSAITYTINGPITASFMKFGTTGSVTFQAGAGRTLVQVDGTAILNGAAGSTATIMSVGTTDYLRVSNA